MPRRVILSTFHSVAEHDDLRLLASLGYEVLSLGAYLDPRHPGDDKRGPLDIDPVDPAIVELCRDTQAAKTDLPGEVIEWLGRDGVVIWHHFPELLLPQWPKLKAAGARVIWRSCGQTDDRLEALMRYYRHQGLERCAYSPRESAAPSYAGHDALIRFYADPEVWNAWTGRVPVVTNITQRLVQRGNATNAQFWYAATDGLDALPVGDGSEEAGGPGVVPFPAMQEALRVARAYLYTGTQPAPYTLGFLEAAMTGIPIVSIGPRAWGSWFVHSPDLFEAHALSWRWSDDPEVARGYLRELLDDEALAAEASAEQRAIALEAFDMTKVGQAWAEYLR